MGLFTKLFSRSIKDVGKSPSAGPKTILRSIDEKDISALQSDKIKVDQSGKGGTTLRKEAGPEISALEMAERRDWEVKTLPVYEPGDEIMDLYKVEDVRSGAMGHVYIATHKKWKRKLAIKAPNELILAERDFYARVIREAKSWTEMGLHPNIAYCYYVRNIDEVPHIVVEYVDGGNLRDWILDGKCLDYRTSLDLAIQFCHGLEYAHSKEMIHRDIKPENILMTRDGILKITDFGLVRIDEQTIDTGAQNLSSSADTSLTRYGDQMGTPDYMAPEQFDNPHGVDQRADIYAFGLCLYEMFCGNRPELCKDKLPSDPATLRQDKEFPPALAGVLKKSIQWNRSDRFDSCTTLRRELTRIYEELYSEASPYAEMELVGLEASGLNNQGVSYWELKQYDKARECFEKAAAKEGLHPQANWNLGNFEMLNMALAHPDWREMTIKMLQNILQESGISLEETEQLVTAAEQGKNFLDGISYSMFSKLKNISSLTISPNRRWIAASDDNGQVNMWISEQGRFIRSLQGKVKGFIDVQFSPDSQYLHALQSFSTYRPGKKEKNINKYMVWKTQTGGLVKTKQRLSFHHLRRTSPDGQMMATTGANNSIIIWKGKDETEINKHKKKNTSYRILSGHSSWINAIKFSPDGKWLASGSHDTSVRLWDIETGEKVKSLEGHTQTVETVCFSPDNRLLVSGGFDKQVRVWNIETGLNIKTLDFQDVVGCLWFSPNGNYIVVGGQNRSNIALLDIKRWQLIKSIGQFIFGYSGIAFSLDDRLMVTTDIEHRLRLWIGELRTMQLSPIDDYGALIKQKSQKDLQLKKINKDIFSGNYSQAYASVIDEWSKHGFGRNNVLKIPYDLLRSKGKYIKVKAVFPRDRLDGHAGNVESLDFAPDGKLLASGSTDNTIRIWEVETGKLMKTLTGHSDDVRALAFTPDSQTLASGSSDKTIKIWDMNSDRVLRSMNTPSNVTSIALSPDGEDLAGVCDNQELIYLWNVNTGQLGKTLTDTTEISEVSFSTDGKLLASAGYDDNNIKIWDLNAERPIIILEYHNKSILAIDFSNDGRLLASSDADGMIHVWEVESSTLVRSFDRHSNYVTSVAFSPDDQFLASCGWDKTVRLWDVNSGNEIAVLSEHLDNVDSVVFSPDGQFLASGSGDNTVRLWFIVPELEFNSSGK